MNRLRSVRGGGLGRHRTIHYGLHTVPVSPADRADLHTTDHARTRHVHAYREPTGACRHPITEETL
jgi:hypothetical protein